MNIEVLKFNKVGSITDKHSDINIKVVPTLPLLETLIVLSVLITYKPPIETKSSLIISKIRKL